MQRHINIPVHLIDYVVKLSIQPELRVFVAAKMVTSGIFKKNSPQFQAICDYSMNTERTVNKYLNRLIDRGWIGCDYSTCTYYVRSWGYLRSRDIFYRRSSASFQYSDMATFNAFVAGCLICEQIKKYEYYLKYVALNKRRNKLMLKCKQKGRLIKSVVNKGRTTLQDFSADLPASLNMPDYLGFSNMRIAKLLKCKYTHACNLKHVAEKAGYILTKPKVKVIQELSKPDYTIRSLHYKGIGDAARKLRFTSAKGGGEMQILLIQQLHDEIIPRMKFKRVDYWQKYLKKVKRSKKSD